MAYLWPVHPQLLPDELLSSWMIRLAHGNGFKVQSFYAQFFGRHREIWTRDIDHQAPLWLIEGLAARTGLPVERIKQATLRTFESYVFERFNEVGTTRWVMPLSVYHRTRRAYGQQFCPVCLEKDSTPYLRREWRLALAVICPFHGVLLQDRCGVCGRPITPHRADMVQRSGRREGLSMLRCSFCGSLIGAPPSPVDDDDLAMQARITEAIRSGFAWIGGAPHYSHLFFDGLRLLMIGARSTSLIDMRARITFERCSTQDRLRALRVAIGFLDQWPEGFLRYCASVPHPYTTFTNGGIGAPWWLYGVVRRELYEEHAELSPEEIGAIASATRRMTGSITHTAARAISGRDIGQALRSLPLAIDVVNQFMTALDAQVFEASGPQRLLLLRDRTMFMLGRHLQLSQPQLLAMKMTHLNSLLTEVAAKASSDLVAEAVKMYALDIRPKIAETIATDALFISRQGRGIRPSSVGARFREAITLAGLHSILKNWHHWIV